MKDEHATTAAGKLPALFTSFQLRSVTFRNRLVVSPMCQYCAAFGRAGDWHFAHHARFALGGVGGAVIEATGVTPEGRITTGCLGLWDDDQVPGLARIASLYHGQGIPVGIQLAHAGRKASAAVPLAGAGPLIDTDPPAAWEAVAPSALPYGPGWPAPRALDEAGIAAVIAAFAAAARRAVAAGLDFVEIHGAHGYLLHSFFAPISNRREDPWGGSLEARMRLPLAVAHAVRAAVPESMPVLYRVSAIDPFEGGVALEDTLALARTLKDAGVDLLDCSAGGIIAADPSSPAPAPQPGHLVPLARAVRTEAGIPTMAVGLINRAALAEEVVAGGSADLVALGRALLADPNFPYRAALALHHPAPHEVLPAPYALALKRRG